MNWLHAVLGRYVTFAFLVLVSFFGVVYLSAHASGSHVSNSLSLDNLGSCKDTNTTGATNPNKFLFISCGVFLD